MPQARGRAGGMDGQLARERPANGSEVPGSGSRHRSFRVALVDRDETLHALMARGIQAHEPFWALHTFRSPDQVVTSLNKLRPDVVITDPFEWSSSRVNRIHNLRHSVPETPIVVYTRSTNADEIVRTLWGGATGYLVKPVPVLQLLAALRAAAEGRAPLCQQARAAIVSCIRRVGAGFSLAGLSKRQEQVLSLLAQNLQRQRNRKAPPTLAQHSARPLCSRHQEARGLRPDGGFSKGLRQQQVAFPRGRLECLQLRNKPD